MGFAKHSFLPTNMKIILAQSLQLTPKQVKAWFQNRRHRQKMQDKERRKAVQTQTQIQEKVVLNLKRKSPVLVFRQMYQRVDNGCIVSDKSSGFRETKQNNISLTLITPTTHSYNNFRKCVSSSI